MNIVKMTAIEIPKDFTKPYQDAPRATVKPVLK